MATEGAMYMITAVILLALPGALFNNASNSGLVISPGTIGNCDSTLDICNFTNSVGCQLNPANCALTGQSISFLNGNSPFTQLIQGNLFALFNNLNPLSSSGAAQTSWSGTHGPFDVTGSPIYYAADCQGSPGGASRSQTNWALGRCTQTSNDGKNVTEANVATWNNWNTNWNTTVALQFFNLGNTTYPRTCTELAQINYTLFGNSGYTYFGCSINSGAPVQGLGTQPHHRSWAYLVAMPLSYGIMPVGASHQQLFVQLESWWTNQCVTNQNLGYYNSVPCQNFLNGFKGFTIPGTAVNFVPNSAGGIVFGFIAGIILLLGGLGLQLGFGGGVSAGVNRQGTKLFQVLGIALILWTFMYSQFSTWFTSGYLPYGLDGAFGIVSVMISAAFFFGVYKQATAN